MSSFASSLRILAVTLSLSAATVAATAGAGAAVGTAADAPTPVPAFLATVPFSSLPVSCSLSADAVFAPSRILSDLHKVAYWQLANRPAPDNRRPTNSDWTFAAFYAGLMALADVSPRAAVFHEEVRAVGVANKWGPAPRKASRYHADDHAIFQSYIELADRCRRPEYAAGAREYFDWRIANPPPNPENLSWRKEGWKVTDKWAWCDALFMAPPALARLYEFTGDRRYLDILNRLWWQTTDYLYDKTERLYFRDSRYFESRTVKGAEVPAPREKNGAKIFWGRGNGWVIAGIARVLQSLPADYADRPRYLQLFREMAERLASLQGADGCWRSSLLDPESYPAPETSSTGFITYALAWGVNAGVLDRAKYWPHVAAGWRGLLAHVDLDGKLGSCQPIGADPRKIKPSDTDLYGTGAFLLAGSEIYKDASRTAFTGATGDAAAALAALGDVAPAVRVRFAPERMDDFIWENDRIAHRVYGPALVTGEGTCTAGVDVILKSVHHPVLDTFYKRGDYHRDHGEGLDCYDVGASQGLGGTVLYDTATKQWIPAGNFEKWRILESGPRRAVFELTYPPRLVADTAGAGKLTVTETKTITVTAGSDFTKITSRFHVTGGNAKSHFDAAVALLQPTWPNRWKHKRAPFPLLDKTGTGAAAGKPAAAKNPAATGKAAGNGLYIADWQKNRGDNGFTGVAIVVPGLPHTAPRPEFRNADGHWLITQRLGPAHASNPRELTLTYYVGAGWSKAWFPTEKSWLDAVRRFAGAGTGGN
jgi:rhamnogalacturonyl hydrolase YesR